MIVVCYNIPSTTGSRLFPKSIAEKHLSLQHVQWVQRHKNQKLPKCFHCLKTDKGYEMIYKCVIRLKGIFLTLRCLISYPEMLQYVIYTLLLFILFLYCAMLKYIEAHRGSPLSWYWSCSGGFNNLLKGRKEKKRDFNNA